MTTDRERILARLGEGSPAWNRWRIDQVILRPNLREANLRGARLYGADLRGADLSEADLSEAHFGWTAVAAVDLGTTRGLETILHNGPSSIGIDTIYMSSGVIPAPFLRGAGVPDVFIENMRSLIGGVRPIEFYSCFISYSSKDEGFAKRLHADLQANSIRCWFAPENMKTGDKIRDSIDQAIRVYDKLLVILSEPSVQSTWVEDEIESALEKELQRKQLVLFPIRLDQAAMESTKAWAKKIRRRHIGNFCAWKDHESYQKAFERLMKDLQIEDMSQEEPT